MRATAFIQRQRQMPCPTRKQGGKAKSKGMSDELVLVLVVRDRSGQHADFQLERLDGVHVIGWTRPSRGVCSATVAFLRSKRRARFISSFLEDRLDSGVWLITQAEHHARHAGLSNQGLLRAGSYQTIGNDR
jgi:hypothetical protein